MTKSLKPRQAGKLGLLTMAALLIAFSMFTITEPEHSLASNTPASISSGGEFTCSLTTDGGVKCWGTNDPGSLGDGTGGNSGLDFSTVPVDVCADAACAAPLSGITAVSAGNLHACALKASGGVKCWGRSEDGQVGSAALGRNYLTPVDVCEVYVLGTCEVYLTDVVSISAGGKGGEGHTCAVTTSGIVKCWGDNHRGQLGNGHNFQDEPVKDRATAVDVCADAACTGPLTGTVSVSAGDFHTCALTTSGTVKCWGQNTFGQLGDGNTTTNSFFPDSTTPVDVCEDASCAAPLGGIVAVSVGDSFSCALTTGATVKCWGQHGSSGRLGAGPGPGPNCNGVCYATPVDVCEDAVCAQPLGGVKAITAGQNHACALMISGGAKCWGVGGDGKLGDGTATNRTTPVDVCADAGCATLLAGVQNISAGESHTCAVLSDSTAKCWGNNFVGALGDGSRDNSLVPVDVLGLSTQKAGLDGDGINGDIDTDPQSYSDAFSDVPHGGTTAGTIDERRGLTLYVADAPGPAGVTIVAAGTGGPAAVSVCQSTTPATLSLTTGDELVVTCGSVTSNVIAGPVVVQVGTILVSIPSGSEAVATEPTPGSFDVANSPGSASPITVGGVSVTPGSVETGLTDTDGDGLLDLVETATGTFTDPSDTGTDPADPDTDDDGLADGAEVLVHATDAFVSDTDADGCTDGPETGPDATMGGLRDPLYPWDYYDVSIPRDGVIDLPNDILGVIQHFSPQGNPPYDANYDRGPTIAINHWERDAPDGVIDLPNDILGVIQQFNPLGCRL